MLKEYDSNSTYDFASQFEVTFWLNLITSCIIAALLIINVLRHAVGFMKKSLPYSQILK